MAAVSTLASALQGWLGLPISQVATTPLNGIHELAFAPPTRAVLAFANRADTIATGKPVLTFTFSVGSLAGEGHLVTDPSCLAEFLAGLHAAQRAVGCK